MLTVCSTWSLYVKALQSGWLQCLLSGVLVFLSACRVQYLCMQFFRNGVVGVFKTVQSRKTEEGNKTAVRETIPRKVEKGGETSREKKPRIKVWEGRPF